MEEPGSSAISGVSVVIPCLNEEASIAQVIEAARTGIAAVGGAGEVIVVDNGSSDHSVEIARSHGARVLTETHRGYGSALRRLSRFQPPAPRCRASAS